MEKKKLKAIDIVYIAIGAALMAVCSWISIPFVVPFTLQTFAVFLTVNLLGGKRGSISVLVYILLGAVGLPVFANFKGGLGALLGTTGGYIIGFLFTAAVMWALEKISSKNIALNAAVMLLGLLVCYAFGTAWFMYVYIRDNGAVTLFTVLSWCVIPFIVPDVIKIALALFISRNKGVRRVING
ncbi:MAG: biotin transporter BioY [Lachnospiraceae bacterium]|nr:biotin transporter BioY [Lachnospiraceae bacterium]